MSLLPSLFLSLSLSGENGAVPLVKEDFHAARFNIRWEGGGRNDIILPSLLKLVITLIIALAFSRGVGRVSRIQGKIRGVMAASR